MVLNPLGRWSVGVAMIKRWFRWVPRISFSSLQHLNFILIHYMYIIGMALIGSIILYGSGKFPYVDMLFFASGGATQAGLNTINVNALFLYQQIIIYMLAMLCNPIVVHSSVVFVRLYWFEKRFQHIVHDARSLRKQRTISKTITEMRAERDLNREERGVGFRKINVVRNANGVAEGRRVDNDMEVMDEPFESVPKNFAESSSSASDGHSPDHQDDDDVAVIDDDEPVASRLSRPRNRDILFADEITPVKSLANEDRVPERRTAEQHIAFVENQQNPKDKTTLRIPGPRDVERGEAVRSVREGEDDNDLNRQDTWDEGSPTMSRQRASQAENGEFNADDHPVRRHITIDDPRGTDANAQHRSIYPRKPTRQRSFQDDDRSGPTALGNLGVRTFNRILSRTKSQGREEQPYFSWTATIGRNSTFVDLTEEQRDQLGGIEYRSLKTLAWVLICYFIGFHLLGVVIMLPWIVRTQPYTNIVRAAATSPPWWAVFTSASLFNDLGLALTPDSMISFNESALVLLLGTFLIIIGNTGFPCMLRFVIWVASKCVPPHSAVWEEFQFLLDHPRRCFTLLFPKAATWWLFLVLVLLNGIDLIFFVILDLDAEAVASLPPGFKFLDGLFQAAATRTAGFSVVNLSALHPAIQVSYLIMMYISVFPIAISIRRTNVYEEKSLGVYVAAADVDEDGRSPSYIGAHLRRQLSFDLWFVFLGLFLICIIESDRLQRNQGPENAFNIFAVLFEIVSAYGTVGLSLGYPGMDTSLCGEFRALSKLVLVAMMVRGRHRGLPYAVDRAILLPSESLRRREQEDADFRAAAAQASSRRNSMASVAGVSSGFAFPPAPRANSNAVSVDQPPGEDAAVNVSLGDAAPGGLERARTNMTARSMSRRGSEMTADPNREPQAPPSRARRATRILTGALSTTPALARKMA